MKRKLHFMIFPLFLCIVVIFVVLLISRFSVEGAIFVDNKIHGYTSVESNQSNGEEREKVKYIYDTVMYDKYGLGKAYLNKYSNDESIKYIILVEQSNDLENEGVLYLLAKDVTCKWKEILKCEAVLGKKGIDKNKEGDLKTPSGDFGIVMAFGIKDRPICNIEYKKLTETMYFCSDKEYYNTFIDVSDEKYIKHQDCSGEHLIDYSPVYNYALVLDYNKECEYAKGSAIFLHNNGSSGYTLGCISVSEDNIIKILSFIDTNVRICIYPYSRDKDIILRK